MGVGPPLPGELSLPSSPATDGSGAGDLGIELGRQPAHPRGMAVGETRQGAGLCGWTGLV